VVVSVGFVVSCLCSCVRLLWLVVVWLFWCWFVVVWGHVFIVVLLLGWGEMERVMGRGICVWGGGGLRAGAEAVGRMWVDFCVFFLFAGV